MAFLIPSSFLGDASIVIAWAGQMASQSLQAIHLPHHLGSVSKHVVL